MIKGVGKRVVVMKNTDSEYIEQAIFFVKNNSKADETDIIKECERIINKLKPVKKIKLKRSYVFTGLIMISLIVFIGIVLILL